MSSLMRFMPLSSALVVGLVGATGCPEPAQCRVDDDCSFGEQCLAESCFPLPGRTGGGPRHIGGGRGAVGGGNNTNNNNTTIIVINTITPIIFIITNENYSMKIIGYYHKISHH